MLRGSSQDWRHHTYKHLFCLVKYTAFIHCVFANPTMLQVVLWRLLKLAFVPFSLQILIKQYFFFDLAKKDWIRKVNICLHFIFNICLVLSPYKLCICNYTFAAWCNFTLTSYQNNFCCGRVKSPLDSSTVKCLTACPNWNVIYF